MFSQGNVPSIQRPAFALNSDCARSRTEAIISRCCALMWKSMRPLFPRVAASLGGTVAGHHMAWVGEPGGCAMVLAWKRR